MFEKFVEVVVILKDVFMIWAGYWILRPTFHPKMTRDTPIWILRVIGITFLLYGCLPKYIFDNFTILAAILIIFAYYLDFGNLKSNSLIPKKLKKIPIGSSKKITWDMWVVAIICFIFANYYIILVLI